VSDFYIPTIDLPILLQEICGPILGIYKSLFRKVFFQPHFRQSPRIPPRATFSEPFIFLYHGTRNKNYLSWLQTLFDIYKLLEQWHRILELGQQAILALQEASIFKLADFFQWARLWHQ
jgi:hypothetical protein